MAMNIVLTAHVWFLIPETRAMLLEEMDVLYGCADHIARGAEMIGEKASHVTHDPVKAHNDVEMTTPVPANANTHTR
ncbi:hypothetical protein HJFPF1_09728 [Paramyrothecium foliicola]|nr:hypothetical protein HJFPF1_09728 [Paramyrothecium foliicola]